MMKSQVRTPVVLLGFCLAWGRPAPPSAASGDDLLARHYREGEKLSYHMKATNQELGKTLAYEVQADGIVKKGNDGFFEEFAWSNLVVNNAPVSLPSASQNLRQMLSLEANAKYMQMPDLSKADPRLIGPITDLMTFYADMLVVHRGGKLAHAGDHFYFNRGTPASWADVANVTLGQDSIDFDVTLTAIDRSAHSALVTIRHVPPEKPQIAIPSEWMRRPVAGTANNWVQVIKRAADNYVASVGKETFMAQIRLSLEDGRILAATLDNPVEVRERVCADAALTQCGEPVSYQILRKIEITSRE